MAGYWGPENNLDDEFISTNDPYDLCDRVDLEEEDYDDYEDDGQPDEYTEWQDYYGGDDWDHGYDEY